MSHQEMYRRNPMKKTENIVRIIAGAMIFTTTLLGLFHSHYWLYFTLFIGLNLFQSGFTGFCPLELILKKYDPSKLNK